MENPLNNTEAEFEQKDFAVIDRGKAFEALFDHRVYKYILEWFAERGDVALASMRDACKTGDPRRDSDDRNKALLMLKWATIEEMLHDFQTYVQDAIDEKNSVIEMLKEREPEYVQSPERD